VQPNQPPTTPTPPPAAVARSSTDLKSMRSKEFRPRRSLWPGLLGAAVIGAAVGAVLISNYYDDRTLGARVDATVVAAESKVKDGVEGAAQGTAEVADRVAGTVGDTAITAAVKTALAADPSLSALNINVTTTHGSVRLDGPAPDTKSRQRAEVLAQAPQGVVAVDNRLVVAPARTLTAATPAVPTAAPAKPIPVSPPAAVPAEAAKPIETPAVAEPVVAPAPSGTTPAQ